MKYCLSPPLVTIQLHYKLLKIIKLDLNSSGLLTQLGNIFLYCPKGNFQFSHILSDLFLTSKTKKLSMKVSIDPMRHFSTTNFELRFHPLSKKASVEIIVDFFLYSVSEQQCVRQGVLSPSENTYIQTFLEVKPLVAY